MGFIPLADRIRRRVRSIAEERGIDEHAAATTWIEEEAEAFLASSASGAAWTDRRSTPRLEMELPVSYRILWTPPNGSAGTAETEASAENLSVGGLYVAADRPLPLGTLLEVALPWPGLEAPVEATGIVSWVRPLPDGRMGLGISFCYVERRTEEAVAERILSYLLGTEIAGAEATGP